jgi:hypothetical protein
MPAPPAATATPSPAPTRTASALAPPAAIPTATAIATAGSSFYDPDAGPSCRYLRPAYVDPSFIAPVVLRIVDDGAAPAAELVFNELGIPQVVSIPSSPPPDAADLPASTMGRTRSTLPSCAVAGSVVFCPDASGDVHAWRGDQGSVVAHARAGTDIAAVAVGSRAVLAYLAERTTSEGVVREAWLVVDGGQPVRISEDGSGATFVDLALRGKGLVAMTIDARVAMTPAHARPVALDGDKVILGSDAVVFVGGSAERHNAGALAVAKDGSAFELVAVADGAAAFGLAAIRLDDPPREDEPVVWSLYPNGLDPAPVAATHGGTSMFVARVRPRTAEPKAQRLLEIGTLSREGAFASGCIIDAATFIKDVELDLDRQGALWVFYRDPRGSVLERVALPAASSVAGSAKH